MAETRYRCDRCGRLIESGRTKLVIESGPRPPTWPTDRASGWPAIDLCGPCLEDLAGWLRRSTAAPIMIE
jgi:hypothetical protein